MSVGILLRQARESAGVSLEELAELTSIRRRVLSDLEVDNFETSGGLAYARGHIRSIAKVLHANGDLLVNEFNSMNQDFNRPMIELLSENSATTKPRRESRVSFALMAKAAAVIVALLIAVPTAASFIHSSKKSAKTSASATASTQQSQLTGTTSSSTSTPPDTTAVATKSSPVAVVVTANAGSTWLAVSDSSGAQLFSGMLKNGTSQSFDDSQLINVTIGNAGAVDLNVNGQDSGTPGARGEVVHLQFGPGASSQG
jgi:cytoskeletal protein RodZ